MLEQAVTNPISKYENKKKLKKKVKLVKPANLINSSNPQTGQWTV
jgi:hypothetical protein